MIEGGVARNKNRLQEKYIRKDCASYEDDIVVEQVVEQYWFK